MLACPLVTRTCLKTTRGLISGTFRRLTLEVLNKPWKNNCSLIWKLFKLLMTTCWLVWSERMLAHWTQVSDRCPLGYLFIICGPVESVWDIYGRRKKHARFHCLAKPLKMGIFILSARKHSSCIFLRHPDTILYHFIFGIFSNTKMENIFNIFHKIYQKHQTHKSVIFDKYLRIPSCIIWAMSREELSS